MSFTCSSSPSGNSTPEETVSLLVRAGLFDSAITLCQTFKLPLTPIFEGLTFKYVQVLSLLSHLWGCRDAGGSGVELAQEPSFPASPAGLFVGNSPARGAFDASGKGLGSGGTHLPMAFVCAGASISSWEGKQHRQRPGTGWQPTNSQPWSPPRSPGRFISTAWEEEDLETGALCESRGSRVLKTPKARTVGTV